MMEASSTTPCPQHHHPPISQTSLWKNCLSQDQSLVPKRLGDCWSRWYGIHLQPWHMTSGYQGQTHLTKYYLSLLFFLSSGLPWGLSILFVIFKDSTPSFTDHPYNFFFLWRLEDAGGSLVWCYNCFACWMVGFQFLSHSVPPASQFPSPVATNVTSF